MKTESISTQQFSNSTTQPSGAPAFWKIAAAFGAIYVVWGSTYLGIRYAVESIPPFFMAGTRFLTAGLVLIVVARIRGAGMPKRLEWRDAAIAGGLMLMIGNGGVTWAELVIPSSVAALLVALTPLWMVLFDWMSPSGVRPRAMVFVGLAVGFVGVALLARDGVNESSGSAYGWGVAALMLSSICWAIGSIFNGHARKPGSALMGVGMQMSAGGVLLLVIAAVLGEPAAFSFSRVTAVSAWAWLYLTLIGSLVGFTAYIWLLQVSTPARVSTYAYVNPLIAVLLGCTVGHEPVSKRLLVAGALIVLAVALIVRSNASGGATARVR
jgi:drug/metabolite transporter (DMT)-like permease